MRSKRGWIALWLALLSTCSDGAGSGFTSGVDPSKPLSGLNDDDVRQLCQALEAWSQTVLAPEKAREVACRWSAATSAYVTRPENDAALQTSCRARYQECVGRMGQTPAPATPAEVRMCARPPATCMATVGELEACLTDLGGQYEKQLEAAPTCESLTLASAPMAPAGRTEEPMSCQVYRAKCPTMTARTNER